MATILYAEVYGICIIIVGLLLYWQSQGESRSTPEQWMKGLLTCFLLNFISNFLFTLVNGGLILKGIRLPAAYFFKTLYHASLILGVFTWCGYAQTERIHAAAGKRYSLHLLSASVLIPLILVVLNLFTHKLFTIDESGSYKRMVWFQFQMCYLLVCSLAVSFSLLKSTSFETDPVKRSHMMLTASFPLCIAAAWILSFFGESIPVICVSIMVELLCLFMGAHRQQISMDKLTQVNNRQNLIGFLDYKLRNHEGDLFLLMIDVNYFKTINDTYGHLEGDAALIRVAGALKRSCSSYRRRPYIARYGGDEFIVVLEASIDEVHQLCDTIHENIREINRQAVAYELSVSIGIGKWQEGMTHKDLIETADQALYKVKKAR